LKADLMSELDNFGMVGLISEWVFGIYEFCRVSRYGPGLTFQFSLKIEALLSEIISYDLYL